MSNLIELGILIVCAVILESNGQEPCVTPSNVEGRCIVLTQCIPLLELLTKSNTSPEAREILKRSACGSVLSTPKVCCPIHYQGPKSKETEDKPVATVQDRWAFNLVPGPPDVTNHPNLRLLDLDNCGRLTEPKIIGGNTTGVLEFPWMALLAYNFQERTTTFICGGTLINKRYVLTAAHCVTNLSDGLRLSGVRLGEHDTSKARDCDLIKGVEVLCADSYQNFFFENIHVHGGYKPDKLDDDIALIRLDHDADFKSLNVRPICLPIGDASTLRSQRVIVTGWGTTEKGFRSQKLLKVTLDVVSNDECDRVYRRNSKIAITYKQLCAGGKDRMDSCGGDSGGPMQYPDLINGQPKYIQHGIVSFGTVDCDVEGIPGVYTKIVYYMDWILNNIRE